MAKQEAEWSNGLSIFFLKKNGYLPKDGGYRSGVINWSYNGENKNSIGLIANIGEDKDNYIKLQYTHTSNWTGEKESMDYRVELTTTPCNYGGKRYWFICPLSKNERYCGRRVGVLFSIGKWFGCRHCGEICYAVQLQSGNFRIGSVSEPDVEKAYNEIKRFYYNGKLTRRHKRYLRLRKKMDDSWTRATVKFGKEFEPFASFLKK